MDNLVKYIMHNSSLILDWSNLNQGILTIVIFIVTILYGVFGGLFSAILKKSKIKFETFQGPTFCCTFGTGRTYENYETHRTAVALYLHISNIGQTPVSIAKVKIGYHWNIKPFTLKWFKYSIGWFWINDQSVILNDFQVNIGENVKYYPFLFQRSTLSGDSSDTYLEIGRSTNGVVYFEQSESFGGCFPKAFQGKVRINVLIIDSFGRKHSKIFTIESVSLIEAKKYNPSFGATSSTLNGYGEPIELNKDNHGNLIP